MCEKKELEAKGNRKTTTRSGERKGEKKKKKKKKTGREAVLFVF